MTEYDHGDHHDHAHDVTPDPVLPDHGAGDQFADHHLPPLEDLHHAHAALPDELHFPGDEAPHAAAAHAGADADPTAPWPDDDQFDNWLGGPEHAGTPGDDGDLRDQLAAPHDGSAAGGLAPPDELVDWTLRNLTDR
jgi:hypothetical protein